MQKAICRGKIYIVYYYIWLIFLASTNCKKTSNCRFSVGDHVIVAGSNSGVIRFIGNTEFTSGDIFFNMIRIVLLKSLICRLYLRNIYQVYGVE